MDGDKGIHTEVLKITLTVAALAPLEYVKKIRDRLDVLASGDDWLRRRFRVLQGGSVGTQSSSPRLHTLTSTGLQPHYSLTLKIDR